MRLVVDPQPREDGSIAGVLDVALEPGWKTYWRDPGGAGIPPMLDASQSRGIALDSMQYPPPVRVDDGYAVWAGYTAPVRFPLTFQRTASGDAQIHTQAFIGICEKICVPFQAELTIDLPEGSSVEPEASAMIAEAFSLLPQPAADDFRIETAAFNADAKQLEITAKLPAFRPSGIEPELFVAGPQGFAFAQPALVSDEAGAAHWTVRVENAPAPATEHEVLDIVVTLGQRAIAQSIPAKRQMHN